MSFEMNKVLGAFLAAVFVVFSISIVSDALFYSPAPEQAGYAIEAAEPEAGAAGTAAAPTEEPIAVRMQTADAAAGADLFKRCAACHTDDSGGANKIGPNLWNIVNRPVASHEGFAYSGAMKEFSQGGAVVWDYEHLDHFILAPKALVKGTAMSFAGLKNPQDRANLIAYLRTTADTEAPLPAAPAEAAPAEEGAATEGATGEAAPAGAESTGQQPSNQPAPAAQENTIAPPGEAPTANPSAPAAPESGAGSGGNTGEPPVESDGGAPAEGAAPFQGGATGN